MLLEQKDGKYLVGPLDALMILHDVNTNKFHASFFEESPFPGPVPSVEDTKMVRLKCHASHTEGSKTIEGARVHLDKLLEGLVIDPENVFKSDPVEWDGELGVVLFLPNWRTR